MTGYRTFLSHRRGMHMGETDNSGVRGLERGLAVLQFLNFQDNARVAEIARGTRLPRTTAIRSLQTLVRLGFVARVADERRYRLTIRVRELADGYDDESWVTDVARPHVQALGAKLVFPVLLATPLGSSMLWRVSTDRESPAAMRRYTTGLRTALIESASGYAYLACCSADQRRAALDVVATLRQFAGRGSLDLAKIERDVARVRQRGFVILTRPLGKETALSLPVMANRRYLASLTVRYPRGAFTDADAARRFVPQMRAVAGSIGREFEELAQAGRRMRSVEARKRGARTTRP